MSRPAKNKRNLAEIPSVLQSKQIWEYEEVSRNRCRNVFQQTFNTLQQPGDFPPINSALVPGDHVAIAVDPNVPQIVEVIRGTMQALEPSQLGQVDIVVWDESCEQTLSELQEEVGDQARVLQHQSSQRESLRYLGADDAADPIYLNRMLVDADFVLPIVAGRPLDSYCKHDLTGIFPNFADSASRLRHRNQQAAAIQDAKTDSTYLPETAWLLGVHIMICVTATTDGQAGEITAGTPDVIRKQLKASRRSQDGFPPPASLVVASLDGDVQQQTWCNAARAIAAASRYVRPGGTIVVWSDIKQEPKGNLLSLGDTATTIASDVQSDDDFPQWDATVDVARVLARIAAEHRLLIHSRLPDETIELMGVGSVGSDQQLARLSEEFDNCGVLKSAQFAGTTIDTPHQVA